MIIRSVRTKENPVNGVIYCHHNHGCDKARCDCSRDRFRVMAMLAEGLHMGSHALALTVAAFAYIYTRRHARDLPFIFGTSKVKSLAGFASSEPEVVRSRWAQADKGHGS